MIVDFEQDKFTVNNFLVFRKKDRELWRKICGSFSIGVTNKVNNWFEGKLFTLGSHWF